MSDDFLPLILLYVLGFFAGAIMVTHIDDERLRAVQASGLTAAYQLCKSGGSKTCKKDLDDLLVKIYPEYEFELKTGNVKFKKEND